MFTAKLNKHSRDAFLTPPRAGSAYYRRFNCNERPTDGEHGGGLRPFNRRWAGRRARERPLLEDVEEEDSNLD